MKLCILRQIIMISKYCIYGTIIQCVAFSFLNAKNVEAQKISLKDLSIVLSGEAQTLGDLFDEISHKTDFIFAFHNEDINLGKKVRFQGYEGTLAGLLRELAVKSGLGFKRVNNDIFVKKRTSDKKSNPVLEELFEVQISGKVTTADNEPIPGVNVLVKGTQIGTVTDVNGDYTLNVPDNATILVFSSIGYSIEEVAIDGRTTINVTMSEDVQALDEIVVVGYGTQKKADITGAVGSIGAENIVNKPIVSPDQALAGTVAGVSIINRSGDAAAPINVRIRGVGTVGNNQPLWVIDGVPIVQTTNITVNTSSTTDSNPLAGINPNDIESIDVLKDASAAAIYGARAANGVIIVTTKRGAEGSASFSYNGYVGSARVRERLDVLNVDQYIDLQAELGRDFSEFRGRPFVDWQDAVFRNGFTQSHNLSVSGGNERANYLISGGYLAQEGIERAQNFERYSVKANSDVKVGERFKFGESILISFTERLVQSEGVGDCCQAAFNGALNNVPWFEIFDPTTEFGYNLETPENRGVAGRALNTVFRTDTRVNETIINATKILGNVYGEFEIIEGLTFNMSGGIDYNVGDASFFQNNANYGTTFQQSLLVQSRPIERTTNWANTLTYNKSFGRNDLTVLLGYEETNFRFDKVRIQGRDLFDPDNLRFASSGNAVAAGNEADQWALRGLLGRINFSHDGKYLATVNVRRDATSRFAKDNRDDIFLSASAGWRLSEESFFPQTNVIDDLKIRASWGESGNQFTGVNFAFLSALQTNIFYVLGDAQHVVRGPAPVNFANEDLIWETSTQSNVGIDASLLEGRVELTFDYYNKVSRDVLIGLPLPFVSGYFLPADANLGEIRNNGIELAVSYRNSIGDFTYSIGGNITTVNNEVEDLGGVAGIITGIGGEQTHRTVEGESLGHFYGFKTDGIYQTQEEANAALPDAFSAGAAPGDIRFVDVNGDGEVNADDRTILGSPIPGFFYGFNLQGAYKGFDLAIQLQGIGDRQIYNQGREQLEALSGNTNSSTSVLGRWTGPGTSNSMPRATEADPNGNRRFSDRWVEDAGFMRLRNLQFGYTVPPKVLERVTNNFVSNVRIFFGAQNLLTITDYSGFDPEVTRAQSFQKGEFPLATGQDGGASPQPRIFQFGWQVNF